VVDNCERLSAQALRAGYIAAAFDRGVPEEAILRHTRHRDRRTLRGSIRLAGPVRESPADRTDP